MKEDMVIAKFEPIIDRPLNEQEIEVFRDFWKRFNGEATRVLLEMVLENRYPGPTIAEIECLILKKTGQRKNGQAVARALSQLLRQHNFNKSAIPFNVSIKPDASGTMRLFIGKKREPKNPFAVTVPRPTPTPEEARILADCENGLLKQTERTPEIERVIQRYWNPVRKRSPQTSYQKPQ